MYDWLVKPVPNLKFNEIFKNGVKYGEPCVVVSIFL